MIRALVEWLHYRLWTRKYVAHQSCGCKDIEYLIHVTDTMHYRK